MPIPESNPDNIPPGYIAAMDVCFDLLESSKPMHEIMDDALKAIEKLANEVIQ